MNILQPYNDDTLELISDDNEYNIVDFITNENGKVKLSVFSESNVFQDSEDLQKISIFIRLKIVKDFFYN